VETVPFPLATQLQVIHWQAAKGEKLKFNLPVEKDGPTAIHWVAIHRPDGATVRVFLDGKPLAVADGAETVRLRSTYVPRDLNVHFKPVELKAGSHEMVLECVEPGPVDLDYVWVKTD
jgi:hypothetical protein